MDDSLGQIGRAEHSTEDHHQQVPCYEEKLARLGRAVMSRTLMEEEWPEAERRVSGR